MKLLFLTQKIHQDDDDLAFVILWINEFIRQGFEVEVVCLEKGKFDDSFPVYSLGKENGAGKFKRVFKFLKYIFTLKYDKVFVHMNPEYITLGGWWWFLTCKPIYLWYTHYTMHIHIRMAGLFCKRMFAATKQSMPQFDGNSKKVVLGHGIDVDFWCEEYIHEKNRSLYSLVSIHRLCRSKRLEKAIETLKYLPDKYTLSVYGRDMEKKYVEELKKIIKKNNLEERVKFYGQVPMWQLKKIYPKYKIMINMASETIDKTMVEAMIFGIYPITTPANSKAIGLPVYPKDETPKAIAEFILLKEWEKYKRKDLLPIVKNRHSLSSLVSEMRKYIEIGK
ncbi:MAG: glycosyltransferase [Candidatus Pacebacteria bacterium]|nr:glycosyltransferase [Candidatus Paceibacterota bacterium]